MTDEFFSPRKAEITKNVYFLLAKTIINIQTAENAMKKEKR